MLDFPWFAPSSATGYGRPASGREMDAVHSLPDPAGSRDLRHPPDSPTRRSPANAIGRVPGSRGSILTGDSGWSRSRRLACCRARDVPRKFPQTLETLSEPGCKLVEALSFDRVFHLIIE